MEALKAAGVGAILNCCAEYLDDEQACARAGVATARVPILDDSWPRRSSLERAIRWIDERVARGQKVYVHCAAGRGRSVTVAASWLVVRRGLTTAEAIARIRAARPAAGPTWWQRLAVRGIERDPRGLAASVEKRSA
ncbi:dual specificity protein phosphatase family protein [bacterium]|nr:dual specificity protein phosphatase family protein [bacterium]